MRIVISGIFAMALCGMLAGSQTPEERLASQLDEQMRRQMKMMEAMQKTMIESEKKAEVMNKEFERQMNEMDK
jgi:hypothetical protein